MTYYIMTEPKKGRKQVLMWSTIKTQRKNVFTPNEYINKNSEYKSFKL